MAFFFFSSFFFFFPWSGIVGLYCHYSSIKVQEKYVFDLALPFTALWWLRSGHSLGRGIGGRNARLAA